MQQDKVVAPKQSIDKLFELSQIVKNQNKSNRENQKDDGQTLVWHNVQNKLEELKETNSMGVTAPPLVIGSTGVTITGDKITRTSYLEALKADEDLYSGIVLTQEEAKRINSKMKKFTAGVNSVVPMACTGERCAFKATCLSADTLVFMYDGSLKKIKDIKRRDRIVSFNTKTRRYELDTALQAAEAKGVKQLYKIYTEYGHELRVTSDHPIYSSEEGRRSHDWACIDTGLSVGDTILVMDELGKRSSLSSIYDEFELKEYGEMFIAKIIAIEPDGEEEVWDFPVTNNKNFMANNILVHNCPYYAENKAPVGLPCIVETNLMHYYTAHYMEEFDVDPTKITEMHLIGELAEFDIYEMRATKLIAEKYPTMMQDVCMGFDSDGNAIINEDISKVFDLKERLKKSRMKILETLMATRKERAKATLNIINNENNTIGSLRSKLDILIRDVKNGGKPGKLEKDVIDVGHEE